ncbi:MAG: tryptophan--tRNA ligase, partial [bacterium]|nr:tryptophan--tRNA ligase [bacterium]
LMAADILIYNAEKVPVGSDQEPHLEVAREIARKMNDQYFDGQLFFPEPMIFATDGHYVPGLTGEGKMSKSVEGSYVSLTDSLNTIGERLAKVPTDSGMGSAKPTEGPVAHLLKLVELIEGPEKKELYQQQYVTVGIRYQDLKSELAEAIYHKLRPIQEERLIYEKDSRKAEYVLARGAERARVIAQATVDKVREKLGLD